MAAIAIALVLGCTKHNPGSSCESGVCPNAQFPYCDVDGAIDGVPNECIAVSCSAGQFAACDGDQALTCNASGNNYAAQPCAYGCGAASAGCNACVPNTISCNGDSVVTCDESGAVASTERCALGCGDAPSPHCLHLEPRYLPAICDTPAMLDKLDITSSGTFDTDLDSGCTGGVMAQTAGPAICVVRYGTIVIESGQTLTVQGARVFALVADNDITIDGELDVAAHGRMSGPAGAFASSGDPANSTNGTGGGGAGFMSAGGAGGNATTDGGAMNGGPATMDPAALSILIGGFFAPPTTYGGGGGGGATVVSCKGTLSVTGLLSAGGGGGSGGFLLGSFHAPGSGGGSGGYVVLQGAMVRVTGSAYANGGGGGAGMRADQTTGFNGGDATLSDTVYAAGGAAQDGEGAGGAGAHAVSAPDTGKHPTNSSATAGAGGGSTGFFQTYTPMGITPSVTPAHASPSFQPNGTIATL